MAAAWGQLNAVKSLVAGGSDHSLRNQYSETARDMAQRYGKLECVVYLDRSGKYIWRLFDVYYLVLLVECLVSWFTICVTVEARSKLVLAIAQAKATLTDPEKITGKWNKDDKVSLVNM